MPRHAPGAFAAAAALLLGVLVAARAARAEASSLRPIGRVEAVKWEEDGAQREIREDVANVVRSYGEARPRLQAILDAFLETRIKDVNEVDPGLGDFRTLAVWGHALADLYELPGHGQHDSLYEGMVEVALLLKSAQRTQRGYVEDRVIRGWPMIVDTRDSMATFEAYQFGWLGRAIALAARAAAQRGNHALAAELLEPVLWYLWDGFLTDDAEMTRLDKESRVVYVPDEASEGRKERHIEVAAGTQRICITKPQAFNKSFNVARAAIAAVRAIDAIDWGQAQWTMTEWTATECRTALAGMVRDIGQWFRDSLETPPVTGSDARDKYPGRKGTPWVVWSYRDYSDCPEYLGSTKDRLEDLDHASEDVAFLSDYRAWAREAPAGLDLDRRGGGTMFPKSLVHKLIVTFLNRIVADYDAPANRRFACDVAGVNDGDNWGNPEKQCGNVRSRKLGLRPRSAIGWLPLAISVAGELKKSKQLRCDALRLVDTTLPPALPGDEFDAHVFGNITPLWAPDAIRAKYFFYNFEQQLVARKCA